MLFASFCLGHHWLSKELSQFLLSRVSRSRLGSRCELNVMTQHVFPPESDLANVMCKEFDSRADRPLLFMLLDEDWGCAKIAARAISFIHTSCLACRSLSSSQTQLFHSSPMHRADRRRAGSHLLLLIWRHELSSSVLKLAEGCEMPFRPYLDRITSCQHYMAFYTALRILDCSS